MTGDMRTIVDIARSCEDLRRASTCRSICGMLYVELVVTQSTTSIGLYTLEVSVRASTVEHVSFCAVC
jgi:hypothetical protein